MSECCHHSAFQEAMVETKSALGRLLTMVQAEAPDRAEQGLAILLACALGEMCNRFLCSPKCSCARKAGSSCCLGIHHNSNSISA